MIIRRLAAALRRQDWVTILIEFVIVVAGIFAGLQANEWNEARLDRERERANLVRLLDEAESAIAYIQHEIEKGDRRIESQRRLLEILSSDDPLPEDTAAAEWGFATLNILPSMAPAHAAYDEMSATGGLRLIRSTRVRDAIAAYHAELAWFVAQLDYFRSFSIGAGNDPDLAAIDYVRQVYDPDDPFGRRHEFDWNGLRSDKALASLFVGKLRNQVVVNGNRRDLLDAAVDMCRAIAAETDRDCEFTE